MGSGVVSVTGEDDPSCVARETHLENQLMRGLTLAFVVVASSFVPPVPAAPQDQNQSVRVTTVTGTVVELQRSTRGLTYRTQQGILNSLTVEPDVALYDEVEVGDVLVVSFIEAAVVKVKPGATLTTPTDTTEQAKATVTDPKVEVDQQLTQVVTIDDIDISGRTVVYHGADTRRVMRAVQDPELIRGLKRGDVVEVTFTRERAVSLERPR
jgi:hypothetical protein